jgi:uncharacterized peroxidase-related enzyme
MHRGSVQTGTRDTERSGGDGMSKPRNTRAEKPQTTARKSGERITALALKPAKLSPAMATFFEQSKEKLGFVPNVMQAFSFDMAKLEAFVAYRNNLMLGESGLSLLEREMIATAVSVENHCYYCITAHGAAVRNLSGDPVLGEQIAMNYRAADLDKRQRAMLDFAVKLTTHPSEIEEEHRKRLRDVGFSDRDI